MALREVTVKVIAEYTTKVIAGSATEARKKARNLVLCGTISPYDTNEIILDVQPKDLSMEWEYSKKGNYWCASRDYGDGCCSFIYTIFPVKNGYVAEACNNAYGAERVAVKNENCKKESVFKSREKLMKDIENGNVFWLYTGFCDCVGKVTKEEY